MALHHSKNLPAILSFMFSLFFFVFFHPIIFPTGSARGESIVADGSLGTTVTLNGNNYTIGNGTISGSNQFHSFHTFGIASGESASFSGPANISNIISRVTGGSQSFINGTIRSDISGANLYMINPSGVVFGSGASLDVSGSFHVSTADYLRMTDGGIFYASLSENSTLTAQPPAAFGFLNRNPSGISIQETVLEVPSGETLSIVGGDIDITGDKNGNYGSASVAASGGVVNIASVRSPGEVVPHNGAVEAGLYLNRIEKQGEIGIAKGAVVTAGGDRNGTVVIRGGRLYVDQAYVSADTSGASSGKATGIDIAVEKDLTIVNGGRMTANTYGSAPAGDIVIDAGSVHLTGIPQQAPSNISSDSVWWNGVTIDVTGDSGDVTITTKDLVLEDAAFISSTSYWGWGGNAGDITVHADSVHMAGPESSPDPFQTDFTGIWTSPGYYGDGGDLSVYTDSLIMVNRSKLDASAYGFDQGGDLLVDAGSIEILSGSAIIASAFGAGDGGNCIIRAEHLLMSGVSPEIFTDITGTESLSPSGIASQSGLEGGSAGNVEIKVGSMQILDGARVGVETFGSGDGGNIEIAVDQDLELSGVNADLAQLLSKGGSDPKYAGASILAATYGYHKGDEATGNGGRIMIDAGSIVMQDGALITSETESPGDGGTIAISADTAFTIGSGAAIASSSTKAWSESTGNSGDIRLSAGSRFISINGSVTTATDQAQGGNVDISAPSIALTNQSIVSASAEGEGDAGDIALTARDTFSMTDSSVTTESGISSGGTIEISARERIDLWNSEIASSVRGGQNTRAGSIYIDPTYVTLSNSNIVANAYEGRGGNIDIVADVFLADASSLVDASSQLGIDGEVDIRAPTKYLAENLKPMPEKYRQAHTLLRKPCVARIQGGKYSSLIVGRREVMPIEPGGVLPSPILP
jgi:filamentous hemagglutinin family protein